MAYCTTDWYVSNRIGIGTDAPEAPLNIRCDSSSQAAFMRILTCASNSGRRVDINAGSGIEYTIPAGTSQSPYFQVEGGVPEFGGGSFRIRTGASGGVADRLIVTQAGNVDIQSGGVLSLLRSDNGRKGCLFADGSGTKLSSDVTGNDPLFLIAPGASAQIRMCAGGNTTMAIGPSNVGIGNMAPSAPLHVCGVGGDQIPILRLGGSAASAFNWATATIHPNITAGQNIIHLVGKAQSQYNSGYFGFRQVADNCSTNMVTFGMYAADNLVNILGTGNVGIGTTTPSSRLDVSGADGRIQSRVDSSDGSTINVRPNAGKCGWISYTEDAVADRWGIGVKNGDAKLYFASGNVGVGGGTTRMVLDGSGNMGINTTSPSYRLHVNGTFYAAGSSIKYKEGICNYDTNSCLFMCLKPVTYQYKDEFKHLGKELKSETQIGLIAEHVAEVMPELAILVNEEDEKVVRNVDYEKLSIILLSEVQKLRKEVDQLKQSC